MHGAKWIGNSETENYRDYAPIFRKTFIVEKRIKKGTLKICGLGYQDIYLNGIGVADEKLAPAFTNYSKRIFYYEYDVTDKLVQGENVLAIELGRGFYAMNTPNIWKHHLSDWHGEPKLICCLALFDGEKEEYIISDESFKSRAGSTIKACLYAGEVVDGHLENELCGWKEQEYDDREWNYALEVEEPKGKLEIVKGVSIRELDEFVPIRIEWTGEHKQLVVFPYNISGWCHIKVNGKPGSKVHVTYGEKLYEDKTVSVENSYIEGVTQRDTYILGEDGYMDWEPKFSYKGFQYVEVEGEIDELQKTNIVAKLVASDVPKIAEFQCSNELLNKIYVAAYRTMQNNLHSIPTDTPVYEKNGWLGDTEMMAEAFTTVFDMTEFYDKWLLDMQDSMRENGQLPVIVPVSDWGLFYSPEWCDCPYEIIGQLYLRRGDKKLLQRFYPMLQKQMEFALTNIQENGIPKSDLWDWCAPNCPEGKAPEGYGITAPCYLRKSLLAMEYFARELELYDDAGMYAQQAENLKERVNRLYFDEKKDIYMTETGGYRQSNNAVALAMGIVPEGHKKEVVNHLVEDVVQKGNHLDTGILGTKCLLNVLTENGYHELAYKVATQTTYPSWGYWIENGMTTCLECWEIDARSRNHHMFGTIMDWLWKHIAGFSIVEKGCGKIRISPKPVGDIDKCKWSIETIKGKLECTWRWRKDVFTIELSVPEKMKIQLIMPNEEEINITHSGKITHTIKW